MFVDAFSPIIIVCTTRYYDNKENCYGVSTDLIRTLTGFFSITIGGKSLTKIPLSKMYRLIKSATLTRLYRPIYLELDDYPPYSDKHQLFLRHTLTKTWYVFTDIPIAKHMMIWLFEYLKILGKCYFLNFHKLKEDFLVPG